MAGSAPQARALIRVYVGRYGGRDILADSDEQIIELARSHLLETLQIEAPPIFARVFRWPASMPQYTLGHVGRISTIEERLKSHPGLFIAGAAYRGVGIPDCIREGERAVGVRIKRADGSEQEIRSKVVVDASGQSSMIMDRLNWREWDPVLNEGGLVDLL
ncbi:MAG: hypothetical protein HC802_23045, partial [Caldilineaceae bacterium]|nr:hypothetical protein [Caldilineaceae bacterium]